MNNKCVQCGTDIGNSLWGWCSIVCLSKLTGEPVIFTAEEMKQLRALLKGETRSFNGTDQQYEEFKEKIR